MTGFRFLRGSSLILGLVVGSCTHDSTAPNRPPQIAIGPATGHWTADGPDFIAAMDVSDTVILTTGLGTVRGNGSFTGPGIAGGGGAFTVGGTDSSRSIRLAFTATGRATAYLTGQMVPATALDRHPESSECN